jgi:DNA-binding transcriptional ArsR family regulator
VTKLPVQRAQGALVDKLEPRGPRVLVGYLPHAPDGSKQGVDDYLASGGTVAELWTMARPFEPLPVAELANHRLSRDEQLQAAVDGIKELHNAQDWRVRGGPSREAISSYLAELAAHRAKVRRGHKTFTVKFPASEMEIAEHVGLNRGTVSRHLNKLADAGMFERQTPMQAAEKTRQKTPDRRAASTFTFRIPIGDTELSRGRAKCTPLGGERDKEQTPGRELGKERGESKEAGKEVALKISVEACAFRAGLLHPAIREMRWSYVENWRGGDERFYQHVSRLGKIKGQVMQALLDAGGAATRESIARAMNMRVRDLKRRHLPELLEREIFTVEGEVIRLTGDWLERLQDARREAGEFEQAERQRERHAEQREKYRNRDKYPADKSPSYADMDRARAERERRRRERAQPPAPDPTDPGPVDPEPERDLYALLPGEPDPYVGDQEPPELHPAPEPELSPLARAIADWIKRNPGDEYKSPKWLGNSCWCYGFYPKAPSVGECKSAVQEIRAGKRTA